MSIRVVSLSLEITLNQKQLLSISVSEELNEVVKVYKTSNPKFSMSVADGNHFGKKHLALLEIVLNMNLFLFISVHLNSPATVYKFVQEMLTRYPISDLK